jgi:hypothetical protein
LYYILTNVYIEKILFTNLIHVITKAIRSIIATVLENALSSIYVVLSFSATTKKKKEQKQLLSKLVLISR